MMKLEVSGESAEEFAKNAMATFGLLAIGLQQVAASQSSPPAAPSSSVSIEPSPSPKPALVADRADDLSVEPASAESLKTSTSMTSAKSGQKTKGPKLDDLHARLSDVITEASARWGGDVKRANAYARKLIREFGVEKLSALKPEQYAEFMELSADYAAGHIAE